MDRTEIVHQTFLARVQSDDLRRPAQELAEFGLSRAALSDLFHAQVASRHLDRISRKLQARGQGFYTIGSSGHEGMAGVAAAFELRDPAFLHYRDAAFQLARAAQLGQGDPIYDMLLSFTASAEDPISGGRHKVLGSKALNIPPQTSTIASHLPKAVGAGYAIGLMRKHPPERPEFDPGAVAICSFGDASLNHSTAQGALNTAGWASWQGTPLPLVFVCEDNGIGISTKSPKGWVEAVLRAKPGLGYIACDGLDVAQSYAAAKQAAYEARVFRKPMILHMRCVRLYGHAGPDMESAYRPMAEIEANEASDPLLISAGRLRAEGISQGEIIDIYEGIEADCSRKSERAITRPKLQSAEDVMASLIPPRRSLAPRNGPSEAERAESFGAADLRALDAPQPMGKLISLGLNDLMLAHLEIIMAGEDIGRKGGVYGVTKGLQSRFGPHRVMDTLLDEQSILGLGIGLGQAGYIPMPEIQFLAYLHNAEDQLRGEAATLPFFSDGQFSNPMVLRIAGLGYQKGFGGHFHNDNSLAVLRDIPGLIIGVPSNGYDAVLMYREAVRLAREEQRVVVMIEPIALYPMRDLHEAGDGLWMRHYPAPEDQITLGQPGIHGQGTDLAIVSYGNGVYLSQQALPEITSAGIDARVIDLRWIGPVPEAELIEAVAGCAHVLVVDECRRTGAQATELDAIIRSKTTAQTAMLTAEDSFIATGPAYAATLPSAQSIAQAAVDLCKRA